MFFHLGVGLRARLPTAIRRRHNGRDCSMCGPQLRTLSGATAKSVERVLCEPRAS